MEIPIASIVISWYAASAMLVMATLYGVYMELTKPERDAIQLVQQLHNHIAGLERANKIYEQGIRDIIQVAPDVEIDPRLMALMKEVYRAMQDQINKKGE